MTGYTNIRRGPPSSGYYAVGDICQDAFGIVWECIDGGFPGLWIGQIGWNWAIAPGSAALSALGSKAWQTPIQTDNTTTATPSGADSAVAITGSKPSTMPWPFPQTGALGIVGGAYGYGSASLETAGSAAITGAAPSVVVQ